MDNTDTPTETDAQGQADATSDDFKSPESKSAVLADLATERAARKNLTEKLAAAQTAQAQASEQLSALTAAKQAAERDALRYKIAATYGLGADDIELLSGDENAMTALAKRLAQTSTQQPKSPAPDPTQGGTGNPPALNSDQLERDIKKVLGIA